MVSSLCPNTPTMMFFKPIPVTREKLGQDAQLQTIIFYFHVENGLKRIIVNVIRN